MSKQARVGAGACSAVFAMGLAAAGCTEAPSPAPDLRYQQTKWLAGLGEEVTVHKTPTSTVAVLADGTEVAYAELLNANRRAWRDRHGAASRMLLDRLATAKPTERIPVAIRYEIAGLDALIARPRDARVKLVRAAIASSVDGVAAWLETRGFVETSRSSIMPAIFGTLPAHAIETVAHSRELTRIALDEPIDPPGDGEFAVLNPIDVHAIDSTWNTCTNCLGNYGSAVSVGMIEWCGFDDDVGTRGLYNDHVAFSELFPFSLTEHIGYSDTPISCTTDADCEGAEFCQNTVACIDSRCVTEHGSQVASVISATTPSGPSGAAKVRLFLANKAKPNTIAGYVTEYEEIINVRGGVDIVNETHAFTNQGDDLQVADFVARTYEIQPVQSAGNDTPNLSLKACRKSSNAICVGASLAPASGNWIASYSSFENPPGTDREEPDVVAFAGDRFIDYTRVHNFSSTTDWSGQQDGTSFAAPVVTNLLAHMQRWCPNFSVAHPLVKRAVIRTAAWAGNPVGNAYETPNNVNVDGIDGAGWVDAPALQWFCEGPGSTGGGGLIGVDLTGGSDPEGQDSDYEPGRPPAMQPTDYTPAHDPSFARKEYLLGEATLNAGDRVRATITWFSCATAIDGTSIADVDIDIDLFLLKVSGTPTYIYGSQSIDDNNEGFDLLVPEEGTYKVVFTRPASVTQSCGSENILLGWAARWGTPW